MLMIASTLLLYVSTVTYCAGVLHMTVENYRVAEEAANMLFSASSITPSDGGLSPLTSAWIATMSVTINVRSVLIPLEVTCSEHCQLQVLIGDAIVWWRACVLWRNRVISFIGPAVLAIGLGESFILHTGGWVCSRLEITIYSA